jgi:hypothetical protein
VSSKDQGKIAGFSDELVKLKEYFDRALSVETLKQAKIIGTYSISMRGPV